MSGNAYTLHRPLDITKVAMALQNASVGHTIEYHQSVPTTMTIAHELAALPETRSGTLVIAEAQTAGLGRLQRHWEAPAQQALLVSLLLKQDMLPPNPALIPMLAAIAIVQAIVRLAPNVTEEIGLKWPNDVLLGDGLATGRKVAGVLIETVFRESKMEHAIVGMGINVNQAVTDLPTVSAPMPQPISLRAHLGRSVDRNELLIALCEAWSDILVPALDGSEIYHRWRNLLYTLGEPIVVHRFGANGSGAIRGRAGGCHPRRRTGGARSTRTDPHRASWRRDYKFDLVSGQVLARIAFSNRRII